MPADTSLTPLLLQGIVTLAGGSTAAAVVGAIVSHRSTRAAVSKTVAETGKTEAEIVGTGASTAAAQVDTAMDILREMRIDLLAVRGDLAAARVEIAALQRWRGAHERLLDAHGAWDTRVFTVLQERGVDVGPPPPLRTDPI